MRNEGSCQEMLDLLRGQASERQKVAAIRTLANLVPLLDEDQRRFVLGRLHRIRMEERSELIENLLTLLFIVFGDFTARKEASALFEQYAPSLPEAFQRQVAEGFSRMAAASIARSKKGGVEGQEPKTPINPADLKAEVERKGYHMHVGQTLQIGHHTSWWTLTIEGGGPHPNPHVAKYADFAHFWLTQEGIRKAWIWIKER